MDVVWAGSEPMSVGEVHEALASGSSVAYNTVKTTMERLAEKGILSRAKEGKAYLYVAAVAREELERRIVAGMLDRLVEEFPAAVASFFVNPDPGISDDKLALLQEAIERKRREADA